MLSFLIPHDFAINDFAFSIFNSKLSRKAESSMAKSWGFERGTKEFGRGWVLLPLIGLAGFSEHPVIRQALAVRGTQLLP